MSADLLREAATLMRADAERQAPAWFDRFMPDYYDGIQQHEADFIASWHPAVALAVADWLDATADRCLVIHNGTPGAWYAALATARAYLGRDS